MRRQARRGRHSRLPGEEQARRATSGCSSRSPSPDRRRGRLPRRSSRSIDFEGFEIYPKQDEAGEGLGSLIRLPFGVHRLTGRRYGFFGGDGEPLGSTLREQIDALQRPQFVSEALLKTLQETFHRLRSQKPVQGDYVSPRSMFRTVQGPDHCTGVRRPVCRPKAQTKVERWVCVRSTMTSTQASG